MSVKTKKERRLKIRKRIRAKVSGTALRPRLSIFRSNKSIYAQLIDDNLGHTLVSVNSSHVSASGSKQEVSFEVGKLLAQKAKDSGVDKAVLDRGGFLYHGRVKSLADGARDGGLDF